MFHFTAGKQTQSYRARDLTEWFESNLFLGVKMDQIIENLRRC